MQVRGLLVGDRAVSPVIGVILMVAITVILAAVVGVFVLGIGGQQQTTPNVTFNFRAEERSGQPDELYVTHTGGDDVDVTELYFTFDSVRIQHESGSPGPKDRITWEELDTDDSDGETANAGERVILETENSPPGATNELEDKTLRVTWASGDRSAIIFVWTGPEA